MVFDVRAIMPKERVELAAEKQKEYAEHYARILQEKFRYYRKPENAAAFDKIALNIGLWHAASKGECDHPKYGLFLFGEPGTGKTTALQLLSGLCGIDYITAAEMAKRFAIGGHQAFWEMAEQYKFAHLIVDDIGCGDTAKNYGSEVPFIEFIRDRERVWTEKNVCTFFTSNAKNRDDVIQRYGQSVCSRLLGMCEFIHFKGDDNRDKYKGKSKWQR